MPDLLFRNTPWGDVTVKESWPPWQQRVWLDYLFAAGCKPVPAPWIPTFEGPFTIRSENGQIAQLSRYNFATVETANEIMHRFGAEQIVILPFDGAGGPNSGPTVVRWVVWGDGVAAKAGLLAEEFIRNPEDLFPGVANEAVMKALQRLRQSGGKLPPVTPRPAGVASLLAAPKKKR